MLHYAIAFLGGVLVGFGAGWYVCQKYAAKAAAEIVAMSQKVS